MNQVQFNEKVITPSKVVCVGRNYAKHVAELNNAMPDEMVVFAKPNSAISDTLLAFHGEGEQQEALHYEGEISFVIENGGFAGIGFGLDLTKRELQSQLKTKKLPWERAKAFNGAAVLSRFVPLPSDVNLSALSLELLINGEVIQQGGVNDMLFKPFSILEDLSSFMTLIDGDIVMTGTPEGVGVVQRGAEFVGRIFLEDELLLESRWLAE